MANYCEYKGIVKGPKNACYAVFGSMSCLDNKEIVEEKQLDDEYYLRFEGYCKWGVDMYCHETEGELKPFDIPEDPDEAMEFGEEHWGLLQEEKPVLFGVEYFINSADIEDYDPDWYDECGGFYCHYLKDGTEVNDECPKELYIHPDWLDEEE